MKKLNFKIFIENKKTEEEKNILQTLNKVPKSHSKLIHGFKFKFNKGNTLHKDDDHIGVIDPQKKEVILAAPWNYSREFTFLHELAHKVWENFLDNNLIKKWTKILKETKKNINSKIPEGINQNPEEVFCHAYASYYCNNPPKIYCYDSWRNFIKSLPK